MAFRGNQKFQINADDVVWRSARSDDEMVLLELSTSTYLTLNGSAKILWERLANGATAEDLAADLVARFQIPDDRALADAESFLSALTERGLVVDAT